MTMMTMMCFHETDVSVPTLITVPGNTSGTGFIKDRAVSTVQINDLPVFSPLSTPFPLRRRRRLDSNSIGWICCGLVYNLSHDKSTAKRTNGV